MNVIEVRSRFIDYVNVIQVRSRFIDSVNGIMVTSFSGGGSRSTWREPPTMGKQLVNIITCDCESRAPFLAHLAFAITWHPSVIRRKHVKKPVTILPLNATDKPRG